VDRAGDHGVPWSSSLGIVGSHDAIGEREELHVET
jgi:hypothetical protein